MLTTREIDALCEFVLARLLARDASADQTARALIAHLASTHPGLAALTPVLPLSMAAAALDEMLAGSEARVQAQDTWRAAALIGAEVLAMQAENAAAQTPCIAKLWSRMQARPDHSDGATVSTAGADQGR